MKKTKILAYAAFAIALIGSIVGWIYPQVAVGSGAAAALIALATALSIKD